MSSKKIVIALTFGLAVFSGLLSFFSGNFLSSLAVCLAIYFSSYLAFRKLFDLNEFLKETAVGYFGLWFITWTILLNLL